MVVLGSNTSQNVRKANALLGNATEDCQKVSSMISGVKRPLAYLTARGVHDEVGYL